MSGHQVAREQVWVTLSDLFLDTDISGHLGYIAERLAASPFDQDELEQILLKEVYPVCAPNLYAAAGNWTGFDPEDVITRIRERNARRYLLLPLWMPFRKRSMRSMIPEWPDVRRRIAILRQE